jgi:DNA replicative helicase MCM subunit Mcm2 (Cdc46/Mcm family)
VAEDQRKDEDMSELNSREINVTVHIPGEILGNLESFQKVQASVFDRFGCGGCNSGIVIDWKRFEEFVVTPELNIDAVAPSRLRLG